MMYVCISHIQYDPQPNLNIPGAVGRIIAKSQFSVID